MTEPDVALTDYALGLESALFAWIVALRPDRRPPLRRWFALFFAATSLAAVLGGTVHGFLHGAPFAVPATMWVLTLLAIGVAAVAGWAIAACLRLSPPAARRAALAASVTYVMYAAVVLLVAPAFAVAVAYYLPAALALLAAVVLEYRRTRERATGLGVLGLGLTLVAAGVQSTGVSPHPRLTHNALYHVIQLIALVLVFAGARSMIARPVPAAGRAPAPRGDVTAAHR